MKPNQECVLAIRDDGTVVGIYSDDLRDLLDQGQATISRASMVEPDEHGLWWADMSLSGSPEKLGPFRFREQALEAERNFLAEKLFGKEDHENANNQSR